MNPLLYATELERAWLLASQIAELPIEDMLHALVAAEVHPFDPALRLSSSTSRQQDRAVLRAFRTLQIELKRLPNPSI